MESTIAQKILVINPVAKTIASLLNSLNSNGYKVDCTDNLDEIGDAIGDYNGAIVISMVPHVVIIEQDGIKNITLQLKTEDVANSKRVTTLIQEYIKGIEPNTEDIGVNITPSEDKILKLICLGKTNKEISVHLVCSQRTIEAHVSNILSKTRFRNRTELAMWAHRRH